MDEPVELRATFDTVADRYHRARPRYPDELFDALVSVASLHPGARLLEIGPGSGQATVPLARLGFQITAVELGVHLAQIARRELTPYPDVEIVVGRFEQLELPPGAFDLVYSATALHWIRDDQRFAKPHRLLRPGGHLAVVHTEHVSDDAGDEFFVASQPIYARFFPGSSREPYRMTRIAELVATPVDEHLFAPVYFRSFPLVARFSSAQYVDLLGTYSNHLSLPPARRRELLAAIASLIDWRFGGVIERHFAMTLTIAARIGRDH